MTERSKFTLLGILKDNNIIIPPIQRDYAQGRQDDDTKRIRDGILGYIYNCLVHTFPIELDLVYGDIDPELGFVPLDGQQRLTTLFLLHWYFAKKTGNVGILDILTGFRYETRVGSGDFCNALYKEAIDYNQGDISEFIQDQKWFYYSWRKDPTVRSMLVMLQAIHNLFGKDDAFVLLDRLINVNIVSFGFFALKKSGLTDDIYIKMNSRGVILTRYENFKVWLEKKHPHKKSFQDKLDSTWTNLFWGKRSLKGKNNYHIDNMIMQFFNSMAIYTLAKKKDILGVQYFIDHTDIALSEYEERDCFSEADLDFIEIILDGWIKHSKSIEDVLVNITLWEKQSPIEIIIDNSKPFYSQRVRFYAILQYLSVIKNNDTLNEIQFARWLRVVRNLIESSPIDINSFTNVLNAISGFKHNCIFVYEYLKDPGNKVFFFNDDQLEEERLKINLIANDERWEKELVIAESHPLFRGCIRFLLTAPGISILDFVQKYEVASFLFVDNGSRDQFKSEHLLIRAILAGSTITDDIRLLDNSDNWRNLLKNFQIQESMSDFIKQFQISETSQYVEILKQKVLNFETKVPLWKYYAVKNKILFENELSRSKYFKQYDGNFYLFNNEGGNWINNDKQFLLSNSRNVFVTKLLEKFPGIKLESDKKTDLVTKTVFYRGRHIWLSKSYNEYSLFLQFLSDNLIIGFHNKDENNISVSDNHLEKIYGWVLAKILPYPESEETVEPWLSIVNDTILELSSYVSPKRITDQ